MSINAAQALRGNLQIWLLVSYRPLARFFPTLSRCDYSPWDDFCRFAGGGPSAASASRWRVTVSSLAEATRNQKQPSALELLKRE